MKPTGMAIVFSGMLIAVAIFFSGSSGTQGGVATANNVTIEGGKQIVTIEARGGYSPRESRAKAGVSTTLRVKTNSTFDCSASLVISALDYRNILPSTGTTDIDVPPQQPGTTLQGMCSMGMYHFAIRFN